MPFRAVPCRAVPCRAPHAARDATAFPKQRLERNKKQFVDNTVSGSTQRDIYLYPGADEPLVEPFTGRCTNNVFE